MKKMLALIILNFFTIVFYSSFAQDCTLSCPQNIIAKADSGKGGSYINFGQATTSGACGQLTYTPVSGSFFRVGSSTVMVSNAAGQRCSFTVTITDNEAPALSPLVLSYQRLWPANGKMRAVAVYYQTADNADSSSCALSVSSNDVEGGDWEVVNNHLVRLRASRLNDGQPRRFMVTVVCTDAAGNRTKRSKTISVAKNIKKG